MPNNAQEFRVRLATATGLSDSAIDAAWPEWWSEAADASASARAELRFSVARNLGLDPRSLLDDESPRFLWDDSAKYKNFKGDVEREKPAITAFGSSVARTLLKAVDQTGSLHGISAKDLRVGILSSNPHVGLVELLATLWGLGVPTIYLRVFPLAAKRMCAMAVNSRDRHAILLAKDSRYPASVAFHVAHEIGHIACGHVASGSALIDMEDPAEQHKETDSEEQIADAFALELLTGDSNFSIAKQGKGKNAQELAQQAIKIGWERQIEPGTIALCYGHATGEWDTANAAMNHIYNISMPAWSVVNRIANTQLTWDRLSTDNASFLQAVMGAV